MLIDRVSQNRFSLLFLLTFTYLKSIVLKFLLHYSSFYPVEVLANYKPFSIAIRF